MFMGRFLISLFPKTFYFPNKCNSVNSFSIDMDWFLPVLKLSKEISTLSICIEVIVNGKLWNTILNFLYCASKTPSLCCCKINSSFLPVNLKVRKLYLPFYNHNHHVHHQKVQIFLYRFYNKHPK